MPSGSRGTARESYATCRKGRFSDDVLKLVSGTVVSQGFTVLAAPFLARLYDPSAFGVLAVFMSLAGTVSTVLCLRYEASIMLPESDDDAASLFVGTLAVGVLVSLATIPVVWLGGPAILHLFNAPELGSYLWLVPLVLLFGGVSLGHPALNYWATRLRKFERLSIARVAGVLIALAGQFGIALSWGASGGSMIVATALGSIVSTAWLAERTWHDAPVLKRGVSRQRVLAGLKRYVKFPLYNSWSALLNNISWQLPTFMLSAFFSPAVVGYYALGSRLLRTPMSLVGSSIGQVFFQRAAQAKREGSLPEVVEITFKRLVTYGLFPMLTLSFIGKPAFVLVFGQTWAEAGVYTQILGLWMFFWFVSAPLIDVVNVIERQEMLLKFNVVLLATRFASLGLGGMLGSARIALALFAVSGLLAYSYINFAMTTAAGVPLSRTIHILFTGLCQFAPAGLAMATLAYYRAAPLIQVGSATALLLAYYAYVVSKDRAAQSLLRGLPFIGRLVSL